MPDTAQTDNQEPAAEEYVVPEPPPPAEEEESGGAPGWIVTFADMMSLLLCFFVLLLSFSTTDAEKFREAAESLKKAFSLSAAPIPGSKQSRGSNVQKSTMSSPSAGTETVDVAKERVRLAKEEIEKYIEKAGLAEHIQTEIVGSRLKVVNSNPLNFPPGNAEMLESSEQYLNAIIPVLKRFDFSILVEGHTDNLPINTVEFRSNWELSSARAANFVRYLEEKEVNPQRLAVVGYGPHQPLAPNDTEEGRARNRRIEILLSPSEGESAPDLTSMGF